MENIVLSFTVPTEYDNKEAKQFLKKYCNISARLLISLKQEEMGITRDNKLLRVIDNVFAGDVVKLKLPQDNNEIVPVKMPLDIAFEDEHILVINKPFLMPVHPTHDHYTDTLANGVAYYMENKGEHHSFRALNRLDRDTTGLVLIAKHAYAANALSREVDKTYYAVCEGFITESGTVDLPISLKEGHIMKRQAGCGGAYAVTHYTPIKTVNNHTLVAVKLETGRTHQIRVHMSHIGHPLAGDDMYGGSLKYINRQALHCGDIRFSHPITHELIELSANLPFDMENLLK